MTSDFVARGGVPMSGELSTLRIGVGVISVGSAHGRDRGTREGRSCWAAMEHYAALLRERTVLDAVTIPLICAEPATVVERVMELPETVAAVFVLGLAVSESINVQVGVAGAGGPLVVTELDMVTAATAAAAVTTLRRRRLGPRRGRVAVLGAEAAPRLEPVLLSSGAGSVANWFECDASQVPLSRVMSYNDVLIDLTGTASQAVAPGRTVRVPENMFEYASLPLPGLLSALCGYGATELTADALAASTRALALATPTGCTLPDPNNPLLLSTVARQVTRILPDHSSSQSHHHP